MIYFEGDSHKLLKQNQKGEYFNMNEQKMGYLKHNYKFFGVGCIIYGILYAILRYKNPQSITYPIIIAITLAICAYVLKKFRVSIKREGYFLLAVIQLLAIAVCLTENQSIILFNKIAVFLLVFFFMMEQMYDTKGWQVGKNIGKLVMRIVNVMLYYVKPWSHLFAFCVGKDDKKNKNRRNILVGVAISIPLVLLICGLFANADRGVASFFDWLFKNIFSTDAILILLLAIMAYSIFYSFICSSVTTYEAIEREHKKFPPIVATTFTTIITVIYICFCILQITYLFNGYSDGLTYSQFAREGFFELLFVSGLNLIIVLICMELFERSKILDVVLIIISICTFILIASSAYRMILYVEGYHLTFQRIIVLWFLAVLTIWVVGAIIYIKKRKWNYFKFAVCVMAAMYVVFVYAGPDRMIIKYNLAQAKGITMEDVAFFCEELESKAVVAEQDNIIAKAAIAEKEQIEGVIDRYCENIVREGKGSSLLKVNFAKEQAYKEAWQRVGEPQELGKYELRYNDGLYCREVVYNGVVYRPFAWERKELKRGVKIGTAQFEDSDEISQEIFELRGYDPKDWIVECDKDNEYWNTGEIYKAVGARVPAELEMWQMEEY